MASSPSGVRTKYARSKDVTLAQVQRFNLNMVLECQGCGHKRLMDADELLKAWPPETTMKRIAARARCKNRGCRGLSGAEVLFRTGEYKDDWWPRVPLIRGR
jgi:hypothetical protein